MTTKLPIFCDLMPCYQCFGGTICLHIQGRRWKQQVPQENSALLHVITSQKTRIFRCTMLKVPNICMCLSMRYLGWYIADFSHWRPMFNPRFNHVRFVVDIVGLEQFFSKEFQLSFYHFIITHLLGPLLNDHCIINWEGCGLQWSWSELGMVAVFALRY
jgi:hypothetical protein